MSTGLASYLPINKERLIHHLKHNLELKFEPIMSDENLLKIQTKFKFKGIREMVSVSLHLRKVFENTVFLQSFYIDNKYDLGIGEKREENIKKEIMSWFDESLFSANPSGDEKIESIAVQHSLTESPRLPEVSCVFHCRFEELEPLFKYEEERAGFWQTKIEKNYYLHNGYVYCSSDYIPGKTRGLVFLKDEQGRYYRQEASWEDGDSLKCFEFHQSAKEFVWSLELGYSYKNQVSYSQLLSLMGKDKTTKKIELGGGDSRRRISIEIYSDKMFIQPQEEEFEVGQLVVVQERIYMVADIIDKEKGLYLLLHEQYSFEKEDIDVISGRRSNSLKAHVNEMSAYDNNQTFDNVGKWVYVKTDETVMQIVEEHPNYFFFESKSYWRRHGKRFAIHKKDCLFPYAGDSLDAQKLMENSLEVNLVDMVYSLGSKEHFALGLFLERVIKEVKGSVIQYPVMNILTQDNSPEMALKLLNHLYDLVLDNKRYYIEVKQDKFFALCDGEDLPKIFK